MRPDELFLRCLRTEYLQSPNGGNYATEQIGNTLYIYLEKSEGEEDWKNNIDFPAREFTRDGKTAYFAHRGFLKVWRSMAPMLLDAILDLRLHEIVIVGYSHGAALAVLCHEFVWFYRPDLRENLHGYGFAAPRVIWGKVHGEMKRKWANFTVIRIPDDLVTHMPPSFLGYTHVGQMIELCEVGKYSAVDAHRAENLLMEMAKREA